MSDEEKKEPGSSSDGHESPKNKDGVLNQGTKEEEQLNQGTKEEEQPSSGEVVGEGSSGGGGGVGGEGMTEEEQIEHELMSSCALLVQCAWRQRSAQITCCAMAESLIEKIYDPRTDSFYYYNVRLDKSRWEMPTYFKLARRKIEKISPTYTVAQASKMAQGMIRGRLARKRVRKLLVGHVDKVHDEQTNGYYYYNRLTQHTSWEKPKIWGREDLEDYNGEREREKQKRDRVSVSSQLHGRRASRRNSKRPSTVNSDAPSEYRPQTGDSEWTESDLEKNQASRPVTQGTELTEDFSGQEEDTDDGENLKDIDEMSWDESEHERDPDNFDAEVGSSGDDDDDDDDSKSSEEDDDSISLAPRRFPRSKMQILIDEAEDRAVELNRQKRARQKMGGADGPGADADADADANKDVVLLKTDEQEAGSKSETPPDSKLASPRSVSRETAIAKEKDAAGGTDNFAVDEAEAEAEAEAVADANAGVEAEGDVNKQSDGDGNFGNEAEISFALDLSCLKASRVSGRIYDLGNNLTSLNVSQNRLTRISPDIGELRGLVHFNCSKNRIVKFPAEIEDLENLKVLDMSWNNLGSYPPTLYKLKLTHWDVSNNDLREIPVEIGNLQLLRETKEWEVGIGIMDTLVEYKAAGNSLVKWPAQLERCINLEVLDLSNNLMSEIPTTAKENVNFKFVNLAKNKFKSLPGIISNWENVEYVNLSKNGIVTFPEDLSGWSHNLKELYVNRNHLEELPASFSSLIELKKLDCSNNAIRTLSTKASASWENITYFNADRNLIDELPDHINKWRHLQFISVNQNNLKRLPKTLGQLFKLTELHFRENNIQELGKELGMLLSVNTADFSHNELQELPAEFFRMTALTDLNLSHNRLLYLPMNLQKLKKLVKIDLSWNDLSEVPEEICDLSLLTQAKLGHNSLSLLPHRIYTLSNLDCLEVNHNSFEDKPPEFRWMKNMKHYNMGGNPFSERIKRVVHRDAVLKVAASNEATLLNKTPRDFELEKHVSHIDAAAAAVKAYEQQRAAWKVKVQVSSRTLILVLG